MSRSDQTVFALLVALLSMFIIAWAITPVVYFNVDENYCVEVRSINKLHNCEYLPHKYMHEWTDRTSARPNL